MRKKNDRTNRILEILTDEQRADVTALAETLGVSQVTVRKDLDLLEDRGIIRREHGYAMLRSLDDLGTRIAYHYESKCRIAERACQLIRDNDTVMIENGSCCALLAEQLTHCRRGLTIITNSAFIAAYIRGKSGFQVILLGGIYQPESQVLVGPLVAQSAAGFNASRFFVGADGWSARTGFTNRDPMRAQAVADMAAQAGEVIVLTESEKFHHTGVVPLGFGGRLSTVITDAAIPADAADALTQAGVHVIPVE